jgi:hypothetical protein
MQSTSDLQAIVRHSDWLAHRFDPERDLIHYLPASREQRRAAVFLTDEYLAAAGKPVPVPRQAAIAAAAREAPQRYVFHSAFCCSTLIANAFERPGLAMALKEPVLLNDLSGWRRRGAAMRDVGARLADALTLLGGNVPAGEALVVKPSNVVNAFAPAMMALRPEARALLVYAPLDTFVASIASKGMWGRLWVRDLWAKLDADGLCQLGFEPGAAMGWTDLQVAAMGWLAQHRLFAQMTERFGARVTTIDSVALLADPARFVSALARHFDLSMKPQITAGIAAGPDFTRNAKTGERFGRDEREAIHAAARAANADEVEKVVAWTHAVAEANAIPLSLPAALLT